MLDTFNGIPVHPLVVHAVVVLVPLAALLVLASALSGRFRAWSGLMTPLLATAALISVPLATSSGESLQERVTETALVEKHVELGEQLLPWVIGLAVLGWALWWLSRSSRRAERGGRSRGGLMIAASVLAVVAVAGASVQVYRIGHSGAESVWNGPGTAQSGTGGS